MIRGNGTNNNTYIVLNLLVIVQLIKVYNEMRTT